MVLSKPGRRQKAGVCHDVNALFFFSIIFSPLGEMRWKDSISADGALVYCGAAPIAYGAAKKAASYADRFFYARYGLPPIRSLVR